MLLLFISSGEGPSSLISSNIQWLPQTTYHNILSQFGMAAKEVHSIDTGGNWIMALSQVRTSGVRSRQGTACPAASPDAAL